MFPSDLVTVDQKYGRYTDDLYLDRLQLSSIARPVVRHGHYKTMTDRPSPWRDF